MHDKSLTNQLHSRSFGLDLVRFVAIGLVVIAHYVNKLVFAGFWAVELFFALSGFLIGHILWRSFSETNEWSFARISNFWSRRWWRTLPNYYLFFFINIIFYSFLGKLPPISTTVNFLWFGQTITGHQGGFYGESWSLCVEEWFYFLFPLALLAFSKVIAKRHLCFLLTFLLFFISSALIREILIYKDMSRFVRGYTFARLDAISYGVMISFIFDVFRLQFRGRLIAFLLGILIILLSVLYIHQFQFTYEEVRGSRSLLIVVPLGFAFTLPFVSKLTMSKHFWLVSLFVEKISLWSYSIYLVHMPILITIYYIMPLLHYDNTWLQKLIALVITILISGCIFQYFELPLTRKRPSEIR